MVHIFNSKQDNTAIFWLNEQAASTCRDGPQDAPLIPGSGPAYGSGYEVDAAIGSGGTGTLPAAFKTPVYDIAGYSTTMLGHADTMYFVGEPVGTIPNNLEPGRYAMSCSLSLLHRLFLRLSFWRSPSLSQSVSLCLSLYVCVTVRV